MEMFTETMESKVLDVHELDHVVGGMNWGKFAGDAVAANAMVGALGPVAVAIVLGAWGANGDFN
jgi:hypothetical protein